jgi:hypothetical protein
MGDDSVSFAGNLTDDPELRYTESGIACRRAVADSLSGRRSTILACEHAPSHLSLRPWPLRRADQARRPTLGDTLLQVVRRLLRRHGPSH